MPRKKAKEGQLALAIPTLQQGDFVTQMGTVPMEFIRTVKVNDFTTNIVAKLLMNHKKSTFEVRSRILWSQISEDPAVMKAVFETKFAIEMEAIKAGEAWRLERIGESAQVVDDEQINMGFVQDQEEAVPQEADAD